MSKKQFSFWEVKKKDNKISLIQFFIYSILFLVLFWWFSLYSNITNILFWWTALDIFTKDLQSLSVYFLPIDEEVSHELYNSSIIYKMREYF